MSTMTKFLALMPLVVLGAACNGGSPAAPRNPLATDEGSATAPKAAAASKDIVPNDCRDITGVTLALLSSNVHTGIVVQATYVRLATSPSPARCAAPIWTSNPRGALTPAPSSFQVGVSSMRPVTVTAMAPNGVKGSLTLSARVTADLNTIIPPTTMCQGVTGVLLTRVPGTTLALTLVEAKYVGLASNNCPAPAWSSTPRGALTAQTNGFRVGVKHAGNRGVIVTATARNGMHSQIEVR